jgi:hypothetical protein
MLARTITPGEIGELAKTPTPASLMSSQATSLQLPGPEQ